MFKESQDEEFLDICINRVKNIELTWVNQTLNIIFDRVNLDSQLRLNDIGCNVGPFWKGLKKHNKSTIDYFGYDIEESYLEETKKLFPEIADNLFHLDIDKELPSDCDITVCSATLEHLDYLQPSLNNMLQSTKQLFILRTFLGETAFKSIRMIKNAKTYSNVHQFSFSEIFLALERYGFSSKVIRDKYTDSMPKYLDNGIIRTCFIIVGSKL